MNRDSLLIGVSGFYPRLVGKVNCFELDAHELFQQTDSQIKNLTTLESRGTRLFVCANHTIFLDKDMIRKSERMQMLRDQTHRINASGVVFKLPKSFFNRMTLKEHLDSILTEWKKTSLIPAWFDPPQETNASFKFSIHTVTDPVWRKPKQGGYWRIHGWNPTRWVRRYSQEQLQTLMRQFLSLKPTAVIFSHSQRSVQVLEFRKMIMSENSQTK